MVVVAFGDIDGRFVFCCCPTPNSHVNLGSAPGDGLIDAIVGYSTDAPADQTPPQQGFYKYLRNTGAVTAPVFTDVTGQSDDPFNSITQSKLSQVGSFLTYRWHPVLVDIDQDGDIDLLALSTSGAYGIRFLNQTSAGKVELFDEFTSRSVNPMSQQLVTGNRLFMSCGDMDLDGDIDCVVGMGVSYFAHLQNVGTALGPEFVVRTYTHEQSPFYSGGGTQGSDYHNNADGIGVYPQCLHLRPKCNLQHYTVGKQSAVIRKVILGNLGSAAAVILGNLGSAASASVIQGNLKYL
jgi:hypothetical protein